MERGNKKCLWKCQRHTALVDFLGVTIRTYTTDFYLFLCVLILESLQLMPLSFYQPLAPLFLLTHTQLTIVTQSCALLFTVTYCCSDTIVLVTPIVCVTLLFS